MLQSNEFSSLFLFSSTKLAAYLDSVQIREMQMRTFSRTGAMSYFCVGF